MVGKVRASQRLVGFLLDAKTWGVLCLFLSNACGANFSRDDSATLGCEMGTEGCACYGNWSCNYQLSCMDEVCVDRRKLAAEQTQALAKASLRATDPIVSASSEACITCLESDCVSPLAECYDRGGCGVLFGCLLPCASRTGETYAECAEACYAQAPITAHTHGTQLQMCAQSQCEQSCGG